MGRIRIDRAWRARIAILLGAAMVAVGVGEQWGWPFGLMAGGVSLAAVFLALYDADESPPRPAGMSRGAPIGYPVPPGTRR